MISHLGWCATGAPTRERPLLQIETYASLARSVFFFVRLKAQAGLAFFRPKNNPALLRGVSA
jgi:hypothetical protein